MHVLNHLLIHFDKHKIITLLLKREREREGGAGTKFVTDGILINMALNFIGGFINFNHDYPIYYSMCPLPNRRGQWLVKFFTTPSSPHATTMTTSAQGDAPEVVVGARWGVLEEIKWWWGWWLTFIKKLNNK